VILRTGFLNFILEWRKTQGAVAVPIGRSPKNIDRPRVKGAFHRLVEQFEGRAGLKL
jgi:hypothetical protein